MKGDSTVVSFLALLSFHMVASCIVLHDILAQSALIKISNMSLLQMHLKYCYPQLEFTILESLECFFSFMIFVGILHQSDGFANLCIHLQVLNLGLPQGLYSVYSVTTTVAQKNNAMQ